MATNRIPLTATEDAYLGLVSNEYEIAVAVADRRRTERFAVLLKDKGIPDKQARFIPVKDGGPALEYDTPDIAPPAPVPDHPFPDTPLPES